jgi:hypothetical protein
MSALRLRLSSASAWPALPTMTPISRLWYRANVTRWKGSAASSRPCGTPSALAEGCATHIALIRERQSRFEAKAEKLKRIVFWALQELRLRRLEGPTFTALVKPGQAKVLVTDEASLPPAFVRTKTEPDKTAIKRELTRGGDVPGALLSNGDDYLEIRGS